MLGVIHIVCTQVGGVGGNFFSQSHKYAPIKLAYGGGGGQKKGKMMHTYNLDDPL